VADLREPAELVDSRLRSFDRGHWERLGDGRFDPFKRWKAARAAWVASHPASMALGNKLERLRTEYQAQHSPEHYPPDAKTW
jgi:hypothetical protein